MVHPTRRAVLAGGCAACAYTLLAGCGGEAPAPTPPTTAPGGGAGNAGTGTTAPGSLAAVTDVPVGGGVVTGGLLLVQPQAGMVKAYDARCPHQSGTVSPPINGVITCTVHGARFQAADGARIDGPAPGGLRPVPVRVADGRVFRA